MPLPRITHKRRLVQAALIAGALLLPFATLGGNPFLRMDIALRTLFLAGVAVRIDQFYLVLLTTLFIAGSFMLLTVVLGRVWCGWLCPQTVLNDLAELVNDRFRTRASPRISRLIEHSVAVIISAAVSFNLLCWFAAPAQVMTALADFTNNQLLAGCFLLIALFGYLNLLLVKRSFCYSYCPYGRFQAALTDQGTLNLAFLEETRDRCLQCKACVRSCPMGIDIRAGYQIECINCGRCIDACRSVMERRPGGAGLINYRFGTVENADFHFGSKALVLTIVTVLLGGGLIWGLAGRSQSAFAVQRIVTAGPRTMPDGSQAQAWRAIIGNRSEKPQNYSMRIVSDRPDYISLVGPVNGIVVAPNEHREITFLISLKQKGTPQPVQLQLFCGTQLAGAVTLEP
jgi:cytochrome c oxidase accessory protein FixG